MSSASSKSSGFQYGSRSPSRQQKLGAATYNWGPQQDLGRPMQSRMGCRPPAPGHRITTGDLLSLLRPWARLASRRPYGRVIAALVTEAQTDPAFARQYRARFVEPRRDQARAIFRRAIERGEIPANTKIEVALDLLYGPIYHRLLDGHAPLNDRFVHDVIDTVLDGIAPVPPADKDRLHL
jgi:hypothetical protein